MKKFFGWTILLFVMFMGIQSIRSRAGHPMLEYRNVPVAVNHYTFLGDKIHVKAPLPKSFENQLVESRKLGALLIRCANMPDDTLFGYKAVSIEQDDHSYEIKEWNTQSHVMYVSFRCNLKRLW